MNEPAIWKLAAEGGMLGLTIDRLAKETGQDVLQLKSLYPDAAFMVLTLVEDIHTKAMNMSLSNQSSSSQPIQDHLTELVMSHLDQCLPHREAIRRLWGDMTSMPQTLLTMRPHLMKIVDRLLKEAGLSDENLFAPIRVRAYFGLFLYVLYTWMYDETESQEKTLVVLDQGLKKLGDIPW